MSAGVLPLAGGLQPVATLVAALVGALAAIAAAVIGAVNAQRSRNRVDRDQWWTRFVWALDHATSDAVEQSELGLAVLLELIRTTRASTADNEMALAVADLITARRSLAKGRGRK